MMEGLSSALQKILEKLSSWLEVFLLSLPNILIAAIVFVGVLFLSKRLNRMVLRILERSNLQKSMRHLVARLVSIAVIAAGLFLILSILDLGKALNTLLAGAGVAGLAVGLALQGALSNTYSGIVLSFVKQIKFGDWIKSNGYEGEVVDINLRVVTLKEADNNFVYLPNKLVLENPLKNYSSTSQSRVMLECGVAYSSDLRFVQELVKKTITDGFSEVPSPDDIIFLYKGFGDSSINFEVRFWIDSTSALEVARAKTKAIILIKEAFDTNGITIPFPIRTLDIPKPVHVKSS